MAQKRTKHFLIGVIANTKSEEMETIIPIDIWRRAGLNVMLISSEKNKNIVLQNGIKISCDDILQNENLSKYHAIYLPGGIGAQNYQNDICKKLITFLKKDFLSKKTLILACCATPYILKQCSLFENFKATCHPSFKKQMKKYVDKNVVCDKNFITSKAAGTTIDLALNLVEKVLGKKIAKDIANDICYKY